MRTLCFGGESSFSTTLQPLVVLIRFLDQAISMAERSCGVAKVMRPLPDLNPSDLISVGIAIASTPQCCAMMSVQRPCISLYMSLGVVFCGTAYEDAQFPVPPGCWVAFGA